MKYYSYLGHFRLRLWLVRPTVGMRKRPSKVGQFSLIKLETVKGHQKCEVRALSTPETVYDDVLHTSFSFFV